MGRTALTRLDIWCRLGVGGGGLCAIPRLETARKVNMIAEVFGTSIWTAVDWVLIPFPFNL